MMCFPITQASKKHYCVNKFALSKPSIEEACDELLKEGQVRTGVQQSAQQDSYTCRLKSDLQQIPGFLPAFHLTNTTPLQCSYFKGTQAVVSSGYSSRVGALCRRAVES